MPPQLTVTDRDILAAHLDLFQRAGLTLTPGIEAADVEDGVCDDLECFRIAPATTVLSLLDVDATPFFANVTFPDGVGGVDISPVAHADLPAYVRAVCEPAGTDLRDVTVVPDPGSLTTGTLRLQFGSWDVVDVSYDLDADGWAPDRVNGARGLVPDLIAAALPTGGEAAVFATADDDSAVVYLSGAGADNASNGAGAVVHGRPAPHTAPDEKTPVTAAAARAAERNAAIDNLLTVLLAEADGDADADT